MDCLTCCSPCIVADDSNIRVAAKRIAWGKFMNSGQTCIAPDYVLCSDLVVDPLIEGLRDAILSFYGPLVADSEAYGKIINDAHMARLMKLVADNEDTKVALSGGGQVDPAKRMIPPFAFRGIDPETSTLMKDEIFGPLLPIIVVASMERAIEFVRSRDKPLALYLFTESKLIIDKVLSSTSSGGVCINDTFMHSMLNTLPFGGVGPSGLGRYHGKFSFDTFSHAKAVQWTGQGAEWMNASRYPPLTDGKLRLMDSLLFSSSP
jgi:acyl-CoA reductase-like NAD-dependent aldehyde dehydrogenase